MALTVIGAVIEAIMQGPEGQKAASMSIAGVDPANPAELLLPEKSFQYWPESIADSIDVGWTFKDVAGASHALAQWGSNAGRTISFEVELNRFMKPSKDASFFEKTNLYGVATDPTDNPPNNVDVRADIAYFRAFCYPSYAEDSTTGFLVSHPPPIAILYIPESGIGEGGGPWIFAVMTGCDVTRKLAFPNGVLRRATLSLTFRQVVQHPDGSGVSWRGHGKALYNIPNPEKFPDDGVRNGNKLRNIWESGGNPMGELP